MVGRPSFAVGCRRIVDPGHGPITRSSLLVPRYPDEHPEAVDITLADTDLEAAGRPEHGSSASTLFHASA
jgi:hypothetical protein